LPSNLSALLPIIVFIGVAGRLSHTEMAVSQWCCGKAEGHASKDWFENYLLSPRL
jgi:hypothetical protein